MNYGLTLLVVACGGALGAISRFQITNWFNSWFGNAFPYATLTVNVIGCFIMGALVSMLNSGALIAPHWRPLIGVGFLGALTTFSTFSFDTFALFSEGFWLKAMVNVLLNLILCMAAVSAGYYLLMSRSA
ncbi:fluoride efflux transporter CrcB [Edwardsiella tarda]|uniref:Fluoride-specific ion channel FluC n=3 Tax=Edwardsiella tarda TaxID=636 RepID=A0A2A7U605_EDWTA|nr:fluoride efflux transporter CrcB [Edwardsiella tarda]AKH90138.1 fluoride efflux transporter CrcB [Edwardsiella tarda]ATI63836.1 fluoride efflux transporter CrcB [Edwardsiella tarda]EFE24620.1 protein CrcB [Edwardsiella tarda ATCC 23685]PEH73785.1 fluoride efflux transporter CrcB [Edwardsiella tarda]UAL57123.1 fluoride efflux transporter CrcB [Edwardsiella tarda]